MRVTAAHAYRAQLDTMRRKAADSVDAQRAAASGSRIDRPSDDPVAAQRAVLLRAMQSDVGTSRGKMEQARHELGSAEDALDGMGSIMARLRELGVQMATALSSTGERASAAAEVAELKGALISFGNARHGTKRLFAGQQTTGSAFDATGVYLGDSAAQSVTVAEGTTVEVTFAGDELLTGAAGGPDILQVVQDFADALAVDDVAGIQSAIGGLDLGTEHLLDYRSQVGSRMGLIQSLDNHFQMVEVSLDADLADVAEVDPLEAFSEVLRTQQAYQSAMQVSVASRTQSIFDLL
jgi:flagellar hook-associated protein 3 FlgL